MNSQEFAQKIKAKYPQYANIADDELTQKIIAKYPQYAAQIDGQSKPSLLVKGLSGYMSFMGKEGGYGASPAGKAMSILQKPFNKAGEFSAEQLAKHGANPQVAAGVGTAIQMAPDIGLSLMPAPAENAVSEAAVPWGRRALGFQKRFLKTPFARNTANEASRVALENDIIPRTGSAEVMMERAEKLKKDAADRMGQAFKRARGWVESENPMTRSAQVPTPNVQPPQPSAGALESTTKQLPFKTSLPAINAPALETKSAQASAKSAAPDLQTSGPVFEETAKIIDPKKIISELNGLRPKNRGGYFNDDHRIIDKAIATVKSAGKDMLTLRDANAIKTKLQSVAPYGTPGHDLAKSIAFHVRNTIDNSLEQFAQKIGDPELSSKFMKGKYDYAASSRMMEGLNNKLAAEEGNMPFSVPSLMMGAARVAHGDIPGGVAAMGGTEILKRGGAGIMARGINSAANAGTRRTPGLMRAILSALRQNENSNP